MNIEKQVVDFVNDFRRKLEFAWGQDTINEKYTPPEGTTAPSGGQCGPSSITLIRALKKKFPSENFLVAAGRVNNDNGEFIVGRHVWIVWRRSIARSWIIDSTVDQSFFTNEKIFVKSMDDLAKLHIYYQAQTMARNESEIDKYPVERANILESRIV